ncbi:unnamed protein product [Paramecium primaurelia]|uniref:Transmembrane protein n=1 Tax=Paramecium primaurelia TaxID=5886 RepID=A0A8S1QFG4_PARPR|nr:unnamed protein product [Paramecium primaurelia]
MSNQLKLQLLILLIVNKSYESECNCDQLEENDCKIAKQCKFNQNQCQLKSCQDYSISECNYVDNCNLENNICINHNWSTCADIPLEVCELHDNCAINNENQCREFTKCEDYQFNKNQNCNSKNENCYNGIDGYCKSKIVIGNCQDIQQECEKYKMLDKTYCVISTDNKCVSIEITQCSNMNGTPACSLYEECNWDISTSICSEKRCNDLNQQNCNGSIKNLNGDKTICYWDNDVCQKMSSIDDLSETNCYQSTNGYNTWKDGQCQECTQLSGIIILINYLIYLF